jgi:hypothetical protein
VSTLDFRDPDLGVMLLLKNEDTGVDTPSLDVVLGVLFSGRGVLRDNGVVAPEGGVEPATLGVKGVRLLILAEAASVGSGLDAFRSYGGIFAFAFPLVDRGTLGGTLIVAFLSLDCNGGRMGGRVGRRVGVAFESGLFSDPSPLVELLVADITSGRILLNKHAASTIRHSSRNRT